jgi:hypothetical protein
MSADYEGQVSSTCGTIREEEPAVVVESLVSEAIEVGATAYKPQELV